MAMAAGCRTNEVSSVSAVYNAASTAQRNRNSRNRRRRKRRMDKPNLNRRNAILRTDAILGIIKEDARREDRPGEA
jgi:hypothetical protein